MPSGTPAPAHPAATVVLLRDAEPTCEVLLVRRSAQLTFHGGAWVFPGGRIDPGDYAAGSSDVVEAARQAAIREAAEEAGIAVPYEDLVLVSRWITPEPLPKRFDTWFFVASARSHSVQIDGGEIQSHRWITPAEALELQSKGEIELPPPTFVTLLQISELGCAADVLRAYRERAPEEFLPRLHTSGTAAYTLYVGDVAYDSGDIDAPGARHRLCMVGTNWRYERVGI